VSDNDSDRSRLFQLDGLRGLAVLLVVVSHIPYSTEIPEYAKGLTIYSYGNLAVRLFFVISGFIVTHLMLKEQQRAGEISLIRFYCRRFLRLAPVYYCYLGILALVALSGFYRDDLTSWLGSLVYLRNYLGSGRSATIHFWSLSVELQFYLIWPVLFRHFSLHRARRAFLVLGIIVIVAILVRVLIPSPDVGGGG
jgi:peptidoglycan/LPS O-acetylase OafA/YrhL